MAIISFANQKGGVGKSTAAINLASAFALKAAWRSPENPGRILVVDMDPQCNTYRTFAGGIFMQDFETAEATLSDFLGFRTDQPFSSAILTSKLPHRGPGNLDYVFSTPASMKGIRNELAGSGAADAGYRLLETLEEVLYRYVHIIIDTGPVEDWLTTNALVASTHVVIPIEPAGFSLQGIEEIMAYIRKIQHRMNPNLRVSGILPSRFHSNISTQRDILDLLNSSYSGLVLPVITERAAFFDAVQAGLDIFSYKPARARQRLKSSDPATLEFAAVANELEKRIQ
ncbi:MAG: ParA family protein [Anaerolineales bacterium]|nr:ParA family protein [Anaerolineales bacterium]